MPNERAQLRGTILAEDRRTERFIRELLVSLGFDKRRFTFRTAPSGAGDAGAWVRSQYPDEVNLLRQKRHQSLSLVAVRDGDRAGLAARKTDLDLSAPRQQDERIALLVPTWSIETWLIALLDVGPTDETISRKRDFERLYLGKEERYALRDAAQAWHSRADRIPSVPSLADSKTEMLRVVS